MQKHKLIPLVKVAAQEAAVQTAKGHRPRVPRSVHVEDKEVTLADGTKRLFHFYADNGAIGIGELDDRGDIVITLLERCRTRPHPGTGGCRWVNSFKIPRYFGGGGVVDIRMDADDEDVERGFNRAEVLRIIPESDRDFAPLATLRREAESINRDVKDTMRYVGRAHSLGRWRQKVNYIGYGLMVNSLTLHLVRQHAPPGALAA